MVERRNDRATEAMSHAPCHTVANGIAFCFQALGLALDERVETH